MGLALLFWFYRDAPLCQERLRELRHHHPKAPIYGLYGGPEEEAPDYERALGPLLDDFYASTRQPDPYLKWMQGDLEITDWFEARGSALEWGSIAVVQWDLLVKAPIFTVLPRLGEGHNYFAGLRRLDPALEARWYWTRDPHQGRSYRRFREQIAHRFGYRGELMVCLFVFAVLSRPFLAMYAREARRFSGFLEYKMPTLAALHKHPCLIQDLGAHWDPVERPAQKPLNALPRPVPRAYIEAELSRPAGYRLFHPVPEAWEGP